MILMADINNRLQALFNVFCKDHCKHRRGKNCTNTLKKATLTDCPVSEWWDLNDWINNINETLSLIKQQYEKKNIIKKRGSIKGLKDQ